MKCLFLYCVLLVSCPMFAQAVADGQKEDSVAALLKAIDVESFEGKHTDSFLRQLTLTHVIEVQPSNKLGYRYMALVSFPQYPYLEIRIQYHQLIYTNPNGMSRKKKAKQVRNEKIAEVNIYDNALCIKGCS